MWRSALFAVLLFSLSASARAQSAHSTHEALPLYYVVNQAATAFAQPDSAQPYFQLKLREPVYLVGQQGSWREVRTRGGTQGYVNASALSNVWIRVSKRERTLYVYRGTELQKEYPVDLGLNRFLDKERRGGGVNRDHWRTPEGTFFIVRKNPRSTYYKALVLNYPTAEDAARGREAGLISDEEYEAIVQAERNSTMPPMNTLLGGWIEIHGRGTGARSDWTHGCVAILDAHIDTLWRWAHVGTPVLIEP